MIALLALLSGGQVRGRLKKSGTGWKWRGKGKKGRGVWERKEGIVWERKGACRNERDVWERKGACRNERDVWERKGCVEMKGVSGKGRGV